MDKKKRQENSDGRRRKRVRKLGRIGVEDKVEKDGGVDEGRAKQEEGEGSIDGEQVGGRTIGGTQRR